MNLAYICFYIYLLLKPFYIFKSGSMQPSDCFLVLSFLFLLVSKDRIKIGKILNKNKKFVIFVVCVAFINLIYFVIYLKTKFILSTLYFIFNLMGIILFSYIIDDINVKKKIKNIFKFNILLQLVIFILGLGRYYFHSRYMGTFNDPNQFGYYILISYMFINLISYNLKQSKGDFLILLVAIFLIIESASTGMLLGISCFLVFKILYFIKLVLLNGKKYIQKFILGVMLLAPCLILGFLLNDKYQFINLDNMFIFSRLQEKFTKMDSDTNDVSLVQERGYDRFIYYPQYILYGSGEGEYTRFDKTFHQDEIHATFPSILFYYGIVPFIILLLWVKEKIFPSKIVILIPIVAIFIESFTLLNQRQLLFWILIVLVDHIKERKEVIINE